MSLGVNVIQLSTFTCVNMSLSKCAIKASIKDLAFLRCGAFSDGICGLLMFVGRSS